MGWGEAKKRGPHGVANAAVDSGSQTEQGGEKDQTGSDEMETLQN